MKITSFAIIFVISLSPFLIVNDLKIKEQKFTINNELRYNNAIEAAVQDAGVALTVNSSQPYEAGYVSQKKYRANKEEALAAFLKTLYINFGVEGDPVEEERLLRYIPAIVVVDYDGYWLYAPEEYTGEYKDSRGNTYNDTFVKHVWKAKKPYAYVDKDGNSLAFTLDNHVVAYDNACNLWQEGRREDLIFDPDVDEACSKVNIPLINDTTLHDGITDFEGVRRLTITGEIQKDLNDTINRYNTIAKRLGITYTFTLPSFTDKQWSNTVDDIGFLAFIQGMPLGEKYYNNYALGGSRIVKNPPIYGTTLGGIKYYYRATCGFNYNKEETFTNERDAANAGYHPLTCVNENAE